MRTIFRASWTYRKSGETFRSDREANTCGDANFSRQRRNYLQQPSGRVRENTSTSSSSSKQLLASYRTSLPPPAFSLSPSPVGCASFLQFLGDEVQSYATSVCMRNCARAMLRNEITSPMTCFCANPLSPQVLVVRLL